MGGEQARRFLRTVHSAQNPTSLPAFHCSIATNRPIALLIERSRLLIGGASSGGFPATERHQLGFVRPQLQGAAPIPSAGSRPRTAGMRSDHPPFALAKNPTGQRRETRLCSRRIQAPVLHYRFHLLAGLRIAPCVHSDPSQYFCRDWPGAALPFLEYFLLYENGPGQSGLAPAHPKTPASK